MNAKTPTPTPVVPVLNRAQYCLLRSLRKVGFPTELLTIFLNRCGATEADWAMLVAAGYVEDGKRGQRGRLLLSKTGKRAYNRRPKTLYF